MNAKPSHRFAVLAAILAAVCLACPALLRAQAAPAPQAKSARVQQDAGMHKIVPSPHRGRIDRRSASLRAMVRKALRVHGTAAASGADAAPVTVYPQGVGFQTLQAALDFRAREKSAKGSGRGPGTWSYIVINPGTYTGNYTIPGNTFLIGAAGPGAVHIQGSAGSSLPTLTAAIGSGPDEDMYALVDLVVSGVGSSALRVTGAGAYGGVWTERSFLFVEAPVTAPAVYIDAGGQSSDRECYINFTNSDLEPDLGAGIEARMGDYTEIGIERCSTQPLDISATGGTGADTWLGIYDSELDMNGSSAGRILLDIEGLESFEISNTSGWSEQADVAKITSVGWGQISYSRLEGWGQGLVLDGSYTRMLYSHISAWGAASRCAGLTNGSNLEMYYVGFFSPLGIYVDPTSSEYDVYSHWNGGPL